MINRLQNYYGIVIRSNSNTSVEVMRKLLAMLYFIGVSKVDINFVRNEVSHCVKVEKMMKILRDLDCQFH